MNASNEEVAQSYREKLLDYLRTEQQLLEDAKKAIEELDRYTKINDGLLIPDAKLERNLDNDYTFVFDTNYTKLRPGDKVLICSQSSTSGKLIGKIKEVTRSSLVVSITKGKELNRHEIFDIAPDNAVYHEPIVKLAERMDEGFPGYHFLKVLAGIEPVCPNGFGGVKISDDAFFPEKFTDNQRKAVRDSLKRPSVYCIQGPPGTGKTDVLASIADVFSSARKDVLVIAPTHQAVNNALNKISDRSKSSVIVKVGSDQNAEHLSDNITQAESFNEYIDGRKDRHPRKNTAGEIVGMTYHLAVINFGFRSSGFKPSVVLVEEAGQLPFAFGALIGSFGCGSIIFFGDDRQMPPIFHPELQSHVFSKSIFSHISKKFPEHKTLLDISFRMNNEIADYVSKHFYEPYNEKVVASETSKNCYLSIDSKSDDIQIRNVLNSPKSIHLLNVTETTNDEDSNPSETTFVASLVEDALVNGMLSDEIAVITPFRRQALAIREALRKSLLKHNILTIPLVDTVERLQGKDVSMIVLSMCTSSPYYFSLNEAFIMNKNRLNVMISRAKMKVVVLAPPIVMDKFPKLPMRS